MRKREKPTKSHWLTMKCFWWYNIRMLVLSRQNLSFCHKSEGVSWWTYISFCCSVVATLCCFDLMQCWFVLQKVYRQQPNSNIFFLVDRTETLSQCKSKFAV